MATPTCTAVALAGTHCYNLERYSPKDLMCILLYHNILELKALGGTDYTANLTNASSAGGLIYDAAQVFQTMTADQRMNSLQVINANNAVGAGASLPASLALLQTAIACLRNFKIDQLEQAQLLITCLLGHHTASN